MDTMTSPTTEKVTSLLSSYEDTFTFSPSSLPAEINLSASETRLAPPKNKDVEVSQ